MILAHKVFDKMAERKEFLNFAKLFGGVDSNIIWHTMVVVGCKVELVCKKTKSDIILNLIQCHHFASLY
jgi:hypothetical protein